MKYTRIAASAVAIALLSVQAPALAAQADDLAAIRKDISTLRHDYEARIKSLEARLKQAESEVKSAKASAVAAQVAASSSAAAAQQVAEAAPAAAPTPPASNNAFNPGIAAVLNGFYAASSRNPDAARIPGFTIGEEAKQIPHGFSLGESEVSFAANIDPDLAGFLDVSFDDQNQPHVEEAYIRTTDLGGGFTIKAGRFLSGIAYLNERHAHDWSFSDASLPYRAFLNNQYGDDGVELRWLAPTNIFLEFGVEWFRGDEYPAAGAMRSGTGTVAAFVHSGDDINESSSWLAALSYLRSSAERRETENLAGAGMDSFSGNDDVAIASLVYKWSPGGNPTVRNFVASGEFFYNREHGTFDGIPISLSRNGWYAQGVYQFMPRWSFGLRYAQLSGDAVPLALTGSTIDDFGRTPRTETALLEYDTSEFGRIRLQYSHDQADLKPADEVLLQYTVIFGPHGAHRY